MFRNLKIKIDRSALTIEDLSDFLSIALSGNMALGIDYEGIGEDSETCFEDGAAKFLLDGKSITVYDVYSEGYKNGEETDEELSKRMDWIDDSPTTHKLVNFNEQYFCGYIVTLDDIIRAFEDERFSECAENFILGYADLEDGDCLLQVAAFNNVVFC